MVSLDSSDTRRPNSSDSSSPPPTQHSTPSKSRARPQWLLWALASGTFAAFNGVFAKLTTATTTHTLASSLSHTLLGLPADHPSKPLEYLIRALFFGLNLLSNAIMWILFTRALTAADSTTRVSVLNTSANFLTTAVLGMVVFGEGLRGGWWVGAGCLVVGSVVIGAREGGDGRSEEGRGREEEGERDGAVRLGGSVSGGVGGNVEGLRDGDRVERINGKSKGADEYRDDAGGER